MKAAIYARYSSDMQRTASIEDQSRNCMQRAAAEGWTITATFSDAAISGSDSNRPQYQAMLTAAERGEFEVLLLDDLSRLALREKHWDPAFLLYLKDLERTKPVIFCGDSPARVQEPTHYCHQ